MTRLLGEARDEHRKLCFRMFVDVMRGMSLAAVARKYGKKSTDPVKYPIYRMICGIYREVYQDKDFPHPELVGKRYPLIKEAQKHPDYWIKKLFELQDKVACNNTDRDDIWEHKSHLFPRLTLDDMK